jgi:uncharacterized membrane protein YhaH (DUF805 family)
MSNSQSRTQNGLPKKENVDTSGGTSRLSSSPLINHDIVFLFIPNIIGYTRVILAASSLYFMRWHPKYCTWLYIVSCLLDAFDGMAARRFGQSNSLRFLCIIFCWLTRVCYFSKQIWGCSRYGYRSMHYCLPAMLSVLRLSRVYSILSDHHLC